MKNKKNLINGWINLHKPVGMSSAQAVAKVKWLLKPAKIGHAGTLDPLASGILPLALGEATKCVNLLMDAKKIYEFSVTFGERRSTDDAEGEVVATSSHMPAEAEIHAILPQFMGYITQVPPIYSAIKVDGERAYALARAGERVEMQSRQVTVYGLELLWLDGKNAHFRAKVGKGTYIRSLGRDIALALRSEGYISRLHRAAVGAFTQANAISLDFLENSVHNAAPAEVLASALLPLTAALDDIPALAVSSDQHRQLAHGQSVVLAKPIPPTPQLAVLCDGKLVALARCDGRMLVSLRIIN